MMSIQDPPQERPDASPAPASPAPASPPPAPVRPPEERNWAIAVWLLYLGGYVTVVTIIAGLVIAYMKRAAFAGTAYESHMVSAIRTFWISIVVGLVGLALTVVGVGVFILLALAVWQIFRCVRGLVRAINDQPIDDPTGWW